MNNKKNSALLDFFTSLRITFRQSGSCSYTHFIARKMNNIHTQVIAGREKYVRGDLMSRPVPHSVCALSSAVLICQRQIQ